MLITIELSPEVEAWPATKVKSGSVASPDEYIRTALQREFLEEQLAEALAEPATPLTAEDWAQVRREVNASITRID
jgi:Arc/MetJ-type ribon-helix-helix transcriptional regulator